jgi:hypothetical protein
MGTMRLSTPTLRGQIQYMSLFTHLHDDAFLIFSRKFRHLYEHALLEIYERHFSQGATFPKPIEVVHTIYDLMALKPELAGDDFEDDLPDLISTGRRRMKFSGKVSDAADKTLKAAHTVYQRLLETGWLEEEKYGIKVTVDMPMGALLVMQRLASINSDVSQRFGGLVVNIKNNLEAARTVTPQNIGNVCYALRGSRDQANDFVRTLRAIVSDLKRIRKDLAEAANLNQRIETYFENFIAKVILKDFQDIMAAKNHPYRYKDRILSLAREISASPDTLDMLADGYAAIGLAADPVVARIEVESDLNRIEQQFDEIGDMFDHMNRFRRTLEVRLRNTVRYAEQGDSGLASRARELVRKLSALQAAGADDGPRVPSLIEPDFSIASDMLFAKPRQPRKPIVAQALADRVRDPLHEYRKELKKLYFDRINPTPAEVVRFLRTVARPGQIVEARNVALNTVDDFLAFDLARRYALTKDIPPQVRREFNLEFRPEGIRHDSEWLVCSNFVIIRNAASPVEKPHAQ